ncbi:DUF4136 domain-containing protein [Sphingomonas sp. JC676]|uniref:DUF4136 domain-containing protein n=1 Tax=Sphingomonas sp. JC676 TaxID=2768065 RepID=UPI00292A5728|nr:DUF4136 domain-containing protein [Sphingomonas sp. JC676]
MFKPISLALVAAMGLAGCTTTARTGPIDVTRYHLGQPMERTSVSFEPMSGAVQVNPEYQTYADAVQTELERLGYVRATNGTESGYIAGISFTRTSKGFVKDRPPVTIGLGGGSFSGGGRRGGTGVGVGGDVAFGIGGKTREVFTGELWVQLRRRANNSVIWEGRAQTQAVGIENAQPGQTAARLASALFKDFPGESGVTITVK